MRTLFSENILSPTPTPGPEQKTNPFELIFNSGSHSSGPSAQNSSTASSHSSPKENDWLTAYYREQQRFANEVHIQSSNQTITAQDASSRHSHTRRKGNPKVLFMGMRRYGSALCFSHHLKILTPNAEVASPPSRRSYSRSSLRQRLSTSIRPPISRPQQWNRS